MIYFDNNATTQVAPEAFDKMSPFLRNKFGNPSSAYEFGREMRKFLEQARQSVAELIGASDAKEIVFTSGGTESDNWAIFGTLEASRDKNHIITTRVEHEAVKKVCQKLELNGFQVTWLDVDEFGALDLQQLHDSINDETALVSIMLANNETGVLFPVEQACEIVKARSNAIFHVDGVNAVGKVPVTLNSSSIDLFSVSGHKFHAPKGIGALYIRNGVELPSLKIGGGQEHGHRAGTEAVHQIVALGCAAELAVAFPRINEIEAMRDDLEDFILSTIPRTFLNGNQQNRIPNTTNISFENLNGEMILAGLNDYDICASTGSACNETGTSSDVLAAMNIPFTKAMGAIRFSLGRYNTNDEVAQVKTALNAVIGNLRGFELPVISDS
ncbi:MAG: cysteine desulfurase family protein [Pyrinomonadaceae bacterium]